MVLPLTREEAVKVALENNLSLRSGAVDQTMALVEIDKAYANLYPKITLNANYSYLSPIPVMKFQMVPNQPPVEIPMGRSRNYSLGAQLTQPIFTWGNLYRLIRMSKLKYELGDLELRRQRAELIRNVRNSYDGCLLAREFLKLLDQTRERLKRYHASIKERYDAGLAPRYDLIRTEAELARNESQIIEAENNLKLAKDGLKMLLNIDEEIELTDEIGSDSFEVDLDSALSHALTHRWEVRKIELSRRLAEIGLRSAVASWLPTAFGAVNYNYKKPYQFTEDEWGGSWVFTIGLSWPIFTGFSKKSQIAEAHLSLKKIRILEELIKDGIEFEVKSAYLRLKKARAMIEAQKKVMLQAEETRRMIEERYNSGLAKSIELLDGELVYAQARIGYLKARIEYDQAYNDLMLALGKEE